MMSPMLGLARLLCGGSDEAAADDGTWTRSLAFIRYAIQSRNDGDDDGNAPNGPAADAFGGAATCRSRSRPSIVRC